MGVWLLLFRDHAAGSTGPFVLPEDAVRVLKDQGGEDPLHQDAKCPPGLLTPASDSLKVPAIH